MRVTCKKLGLSPNPPTYLLESRYMSKPGQRHVILCHDPDHISLLILTPFISLGVLFFRVNFTKTRIKFYAKIIHIAT